MNEDPDERDALWRKYYFSKWGMSSDRNHQPIVEAFWNDSGFVQFRLRMANYLANNTKNVGVALAKTTQGPKDNWCYCEVGSLEDKDTLLCFGTYNSSNTSYCKTYWNEYRNQDSNWVMSAGQPQDRSFQLCIWVGGIVIKHLDAVYYQDRIRVVKENGIYYVIHCKGQFHPGKNSDTTNLYKIKCPIRPKYIPPYMYKCPKDNWCYCEVGSLEKRDTVLCLGTYKSSDTSYCETYLNEYKTQNSNWVMSAGQPQDRSFQLCIWVGGIVIKHLDVVYSRDRIRVVKQKGIYYVVHCKGQFHPGKKSGTTKLYKIECPIPKYIPSYFNMIDRNSYIPY